jgi:thiol-disulfide isomerase/thioredoxin
MKCVITFGWLFILAFPGALRAATEAEHAKQVQDALKAEDVEAAEAALSAALKEFPESNRLNAIHYQLYLAQARAEKFPAAVGHLRSYIDYLLAQSDKTPAAVISVPVMVYSISAALEREGRKSPNADVFDQYLKVLHEKAQAKTGPELKSAIADLTSRKIIWLADHDQGTEAEKLLTAELAAASDSFKANPNDLPGILRLNSALGTQFQLANDFSPEKAQEYQARQIEFLTEQLKEHKNEMRIIDAYLSARVSEIYSIAPANPDAAEKLLESVREFIKSYEDPAPLLKQRLSLVERTLEVIPRRIENYRDHLAMIGTKGTLPEAQVWLNGGPLSEDDLKGKVVLLDFWAVWCGPCIATFPHLREWREKYANKGFEIIGVTRYYDYDWDSEKHKIKRVPDLSDDLENAATEKFLAHHNLKHYIAVLSSDAGKTFNEGYAVLGIPQAVLIDREGKIRMIRVGSGKRNAHLLEQMIEQLLAEKPALIGK